MSTVAVEPASLPRIVCTKCLAEVKVHRVEDLPERDAVLAWLECHQTHILAEISGEFLFRFQHQPDWDLPLQSVIDISDRAQSMFDHAEQSMLRAAARAEWLQAFMRSKP